MRIFRRKQNSAPNETVAEREQRDLDQWIDESNKALKEGKVAPPRPKSLKVKRRI
jgi:hypothetical protein